MVRCLLALTRDLRASDITAEFCRVEGISYSAALACREQLEAMEEEQRTRQSDGQPVKKLLCRELVLVGKNESENFFPSREPFYLRLHSGLSPSHETPEQMSGENSQPFIPNFIAIRCDNYDASTSSKDCSTDVAGSTIKTEPQLSDPLLWGTPVDPQLLGSDPQSLGMDNQSLEADFQLLKANPQLIEMGHQLSMADDQPLEANPQPLAEDHQPLGADLIPWGADERSSSPEAVEGMLSDLEEDFLDNILEGEAQVFSNKPPQVSQAEINNSAVSGKPSDGGDMSQSTGYSGNSTVGGNASQKSGFSGNPFMGINTSVSQKSGFSEKLNANQRSRFSGNFSVGGNTNTSQRIESIEKPSSTSQKSEFSGTPSDGPNAPQKSGFSGKRREYCDFCNFSTLNHVQLYYHVELKHKGMERSCLYCQLCSYSTTYRTNFNEHLAKDHMNQNGWYVCPKCPYVSECKANLYRHFNTHSKKYVYKCPFCSFMCTGNLGRHVRSQHGVELLKCYKCPFTTWSKIKLEDHLNSHEGRNKMTCNICNWGTFFRQSYAKHMHHYHNNPSYHRDGETVSNLM